MQYQNFEKEFERESLRKDSLLELFEKLEKIEKAKKQTLKFKYERHFYDWVRVVKVTSTYLSLETENGQTIAPVMINPAIAKLMKVGDDLFLKAGLYKDEWHVIFIQSIGSSLC